MRYLSIRALFLLLLLPFVVEGGLKEEDLFFKNILNSTPIVNVQQIQIPGYPKAYNPSLIAYKSGYLLSFRYSAKYPKKFKDHLRSDVSLLGLVQLDKDFAVLKKTIQLLNIASHSPTFSLSAEDGRLLSVGDRIFLFFNDLPLGQIAGTCVMYFGELIEERGSFVFKEPIKPLIYLSAIPLEKNWSPFVAGDKLYVIYSDQPRVILEVDWSTGYCQEVVRENFNGNWGVGWNHSRGMQGHWNWGRIRGGTPAFLVDGSFLTFFHSCIPSKNSKGRAYVMGAYTFDENPPFSIRTLTSSPLGKLTDYAENNPSKIVFPGGMVIQDRHIHVAWGKADNQIFITTFDKEKLLNSMKQ